MAESESGVPSSTAVSVYFSPSNAVYDAAVVSVSEGVSALRVADALCVMCTQQPMHTCVFFLDRYAADRALEDGKCTLCARPDVSMGSCLQSPLVRGKRVIVMYGLEGYALPKMLSSVNRAMQNNDDRQNERVVVASETMLHAFVPVFFVMPKAGVFLADTFMYLAAARMRDGGAFVYVYMFFQDMIAELCNRVGFCNTLFPETMTTEPLFKCIVPFGAEEECAWTHATLVDAMCKDEYVLFSNAQLPELVRELFASILTSGRFTALRAGADKKHRAACAVMTAVLERATGVCARPLV